MKTLLIILALAAAASCWVVHNGEIVSGVDPSSGIEDPLPYKLTIENYNGRITKKLMSNLQEKGITHVSMFNNTIEGIEDGALCASPLILIDIVESSLKLTKEMFGSCPSLEYLQLHGAKDVHLGKDLLSVFPNLESLTLRNYPTIEEVTSDNLRGLDKLRFLTITNTNLKKIDAQVLSQMTNLRGLQIAGNKLETVEGVFTNKDLHYLHLRGNKLKSFPWNALKNLDNLYSFDIAENPMTEYDADEIAKYAPKLQIFFYSVVGSCAETLTLQKKLEEKFGNSTAIFCLNGS